MTTSPETITLTSAQLFSEARTHNAWQDRPVSLLADGVVEESGYCRGVDADGALLLETAAGLRRILAGDVSLRAS